eukprot:2487262-Pyramimonas_sp.AAC.1
MPLLEQNEALPPIEAGVFRSPPRFFQACTANQASLVSPLVRLVPAKCFHVVDTLIQQVTCAPGSTCCVTFVVP